MSQAAIRNYRASMPAGEVSEFRIDAVDYLGVPVHNVDFVAADTGYVSNGIGYGRTPEAARLGAYGELAEERHTVASFARLGLGRGSYRDLCRRYGDDRVVDPLTLVLEAGSGYSPERQLRWAPVERLRDGATCWVPAEFVACTNSQVDYPERLVTAIRNGSGAGDTETRALLHGTLELLQRDGNADCFRALDRGRVLEPDTLPLGVRALMQELAARGLHVTCKLARVTCGCVSVYAVGDDRSGDAFPLGVTATGEGCDTDYRVALMKAVTECASSHTRKRFNNVTWDLRAPVTPPGYRAMKLGALDLDREEPRALRAMVDWIEGGRAALRDRLAGNVFLERERVDARGLPARSFATLEEQWAYVRGQLEAEGLEVYVFRAGTAREHCHVTKVIVPGIEQELGSYHRIGERGVRRLRDRNDLRLTARESGPGRARVLLTAAAEERLGGPVWLEADRLDALVDPVYPLYREPTDHAARHAIDTGYFRAHASALA